MDSDKLSISLKDNPDVAAAIAGASPGDCITFKELVICIDEIATDMAVGSVEDFGDVSVQPEKDDEDAGSEPDEEAAEPVLSVMAPGYKNKK